MRRFLGVVDDRDLVQALRRGEPAAFDAVYAAHHARIFAFLLRLAGRQDTAEDLAQETWLRFAKAAPTLREDTRLAPLLFTIARNGFTSYRRWAMLDLSRLVMLGFEAAQRDPGPEDEHERAHAIALLEAALRALPVPSREVLLLVGVEGLDQEEVAGILGISYDATRKRLSRARAELAETMARLERADGKARAERAARTGATRGAKRGTGEVS
jgi:RNA polymerase sigma-70 factor (ECF subfamily)